MITKESIERVKSQASLLQVVSETVQLKRSGMNYVGLCPFHSERSPSFFVREHTNTFTCFGCGQNGNVISYVMETKALPFPEAVEYLADRFQIPLQYEKGRKDRAPGPDKELLYKVTDAAQAFFQMHLIRATQQKAGEGAAVLDYIRKRGLTRETVKSFGIGYAPNSRDELLQDLRRRGFPEEAIIQAGLAKRSQSGALYDVFRGRLIFPIFLDAKRIVAFGGRVVPGAVSAEDLERTPKYLNSPESPIYYKSKTLFGLPQAMQAIRAAGEVYLVEGYMDVVGLAAKGVENVLASCGTAVTDHHFRRLASLAGKIHLLFDGDTAGRGAAGKAFPIAKNADSDVDVIFLPDETDPDDFASQHGPGTAEALGQLPKVSPVEVYVEALLDRHGCTAHSPPGPNLLGKIGEELAQQLAEVEREISRAAFTRQAARRIGLDADQLKGLVEARRSGRPIASPNTLPEIGPEEDQVPGHRVSVRELPPLDRELLKAAIVLREELVPVIIRTAAIFEALHPDALQFLQELQAVMVEGGDVEHQKTRVKSVLGAYGPSWVGLWKEAYDMHKSGSPLNTYEGCLKAIGRMRLEMELKRTHEDIAAASDDAEKAVLSQHAVTLNKRRQGIPEQDSESL